MGKYSIWASDALAQDKLAPPAEKQAQGWIEETPPHEWFNWHMNRTDMRLDDLETHVAYTILDMPPYERDDTIMAGQRFDLPEKYIVGENQLHVYLDGILCLPGGANQYLECGEPHSESTYIRWNDDITPDYHIRVEIPRRAIEPIIFADEVLVGKVNDMAKRLEKLEEPVYSTRLDSPANTRVDTVNPGDIFTLDAEYVVGANQLQVFKNGVLLYENADYEEIGIVGNKATDIRFLKPVNVKDSIRAYIATRNAEEFTVLGGATSLKTVEEKVAEYTNETRVDKLVDERIEAMADQEVPPYRVGANALKVYKNGVLLVPNRDYSENSDNGEISNRIIWNASVAKGSLLTFIAPVKVD